MIDNTIDILLGQQRLYHPHRRLKKKKENEQY